jgi:glycosyltransferase involved in cell wall biosynthesis
MKSAELISRTRIKQISPPTTRSNTKKQPGSSATVPRKIQKTIPTTAMAQTLSSQVAGKTQATTGNSDTLPHTTHPSRILWIAWKDYTHPQAGGAEVVLRELMRRQVADGHRVSLLTVRHPGSKEREMLDGIDVIRIGTNRYLHPFQALWYYLKQLRTRYDVVIETVNTAPYFSILFKGPTKRIALAHQLAREIWFYEAKPPLSHFGHYILEPFALRLLSWARVPLITISESTKRDIARYGWKPERTHIISEGIEIDPVPDIRTIKKYHHPTVLSLGSLRSMKRTLDQIEAFELAKVRMPNLRMKIAGSASDMYGQRVLERIATSQYKDDITYVGRVSLEEKINLMQHCHIIVVTSVKEGWGLIVTEAASQGTPAVVYDVDGLRDSVQNGQTGVVTSSTPAALATGMVELLSDTERYQTMQHAAWEFSKDVTFETGYKQFNQILEAA